MEGKVLKIKNKSSKINNEGKPGKKKQIERFRFSRSVTAPAIVVKNETKNEASFKNADKRTEINDELKARHVSFDESVHVLTKCSVIEMPLKNSLLENKMAGISCSCRKETLKHDKRGSVRKTATFKRKEVITAAILDNNVSDFSSICQQWEVNFNTRLSNGLTLLHLASIVGSYRILQFILKHGGRVDEVDGMGWTALHYAARNGHVPCALVLLQAGADVNARTLDFFTVIELAKQDEMALLIGRVMHGTLTRSSINQKETYV